MENSYVNGTTRGFYNNSRGYGAPDEYVTSGPPRGPRNAFLPAEPIHPKYYADRTRNRGLLFDGDDDTPNQDDYLLYHTYQSRGWDALPEEKEEIDAERLRRAEARKDVVSVEKARCSADSNRSEFHQAEEEVEDAREDLNKATAADDGSRESGLKVKRAELVLRAKQEQCIKKEADWLHDELMVEVAMVDAELNQTKRYEARNAAREKIERVRAGLKMEQAGRALRE